MLYTSLPNRCLLTKLLFCIVLLLRLCCLKHSQQCQNGVINIAVVHSSVYGCQYLETFKEDRFLIAYTPTFVIETINKNLPAVIKNHNISFGYVYYDVCESNTKALDFSRRLKPAWEFPDKALNIPFCDFKTKDFNESFYLVPAVIGGWFTSRTKLISTLIQKYNMPQIATEASGDELSNKQRFPNVLRMVANDSYQAEVIAHLVLAFNWSYVGIIYRDDSYGSGMMLSTRNAFEKRNSTACVAFNMAINKATTTEEVIKELDQHRYLKAVIFYEIFESLPSLEILKTIQDRQMEILTADDNASRLGNYTRGTFYVTFKGYATSNLMERYLSLRYVDVKDHIYGQELFDLLHNCSSSSCCNVFSNCTVGEKSSYTNLSIVHPLARLSDAISVLVTSIQNVILEDCAETIEDKQELISCLTGIKIFKKLINGTGITGITGTIDFNSDGDSYPYFEIKQHVPDLQDFHSIATWDPENYIQFLSDDIVYWKNGVKPESYCSEACPKGSVPLYKNKCCFTCQECTKNEIILINKDGEDECSPCPKFNWPTQDRRICQLMDVYRISNGSLYPLLISLGAFFVLATLAIMSLIIWYREEQLVKAISLELSILCLIGSCLGFAGLGFLVAPPSDVLCNVANTIMQLSLCLPYSSQLVKTWRIFLIFSKAEQGQSRPVYTGKKHVLTYTGILFLNMVFILILVYRYAPVTTEKLLVEYSSGDKPKVEETCIWITLGLWLPLGYNLLLLALTSILALKTRNLPDNFHDSKCILVCATVGFFLWVAFLISALASSSPSTPVILIAFTTGCSHLLLTGVLFVPKVYAVLVLHDAETNVHNYGGSVGTSRVTNSNFCHNY